LVRAGILRGVRGPRGGYRLARERRRVSVGDVVRVVRGIEDIAQQDDLGPASELGAKVIGPFWATTEEELMARLDRVTIEDLCRQAEGKGVPSEVEREVDFAI
jgi:Rrf2 family protein